MEADVEELGVELEVCGGGGRECGE